MPVSILKIAGRKSLKVWPITSTIKLWLATGNNQAISFDAICHLMLCRVERRPARLDMSIYPLLGFYSAVDSSKVFHSKPGLWINA